MQRVALFDPLESYRLRSVGFAWRGGQYAFLDFTPTPLPHPWGEGKGQG